MLVRAMTIISTPTNPGHSGAGEAIIDRGGGGESLGQPQVEDEPRAPRAVSCCLRPSGGNGRFGVEVERTGKAARPNNCLASEYARSASVRPSEASRKPTRQRSARDRR